VEVALKKLLETVAVLVSLTPWEAEADGEAGMILVSVEEADGFGSGEAATGDLVVVLDSDLDLVLEADAL